MGVRAVCSAAVRARAIRWGWPGSLALVWACGPGPVNAVKQAPSPAISAEASATEPEVAASRWRAIAGPIVAAAPEVVPVGLWWIAAGGGGAPEFNQVSIEQDRALARETFGGVGWLLFAGGRGSHGVQVERGEVDDPLLATLADLFAPRGGRAASYRATTLPADAAATADNLRAVITRASATDGPPLLLYLAGHGQRGEQPADAAIDLWGQVPVTARELATLTDGRPRPLRMVITSCFSGGFAELAFVGADAQRREAAAGRCGLFAATAEREASGCDPNPDRAAQEGYGLHFLNALRGRDRAGGPVVVDLDGDGRVSLLEAHARARSASAGIDVPTTTSERWLRAVPGLRGRGVAAALPEDDAVIAALAEELGLRGREGEAEGLLRRVEEDMSEVTGRIDAASAAEDAAYRRAAAGLLARWPVLDDAWHPDFAAMLASEREAIARALADDAAYAAYQAARAEVEAAQAEQAGLLARGARLERLVRALATRTLAGRLRARGGADWAVYSELLACERWVPPL